MPPPLCTCHSFSVFIPSFLLLDTVPDLCCATMDGMDVCLCLGGRCCLGRAPRALPVTYATAQVHPCLPHLAPWHGLCSPEPCPGVDTALPPAAWKGAWHTHPSLVLPVTCCGPGFGYTGHSKAPMEWCALYLAVSLGTASSSEETEQPSCSRPPGSRRPQGP